MTTIRVTNVRGLNTREGRSAVCYVGRRCAGWAGHPLGNPFRPGEGPPGAVERYRLWLLARPTLEADLAALWEECRRGAKPLGCWCGNWVVASDESERANDTPDCHAVVLARLLVQRLVKPPAPACVTVTEDDGEAD